MPRPRRFPILVFLAAAFALPSLAAPSPATYRVAGIVVDSLTGQPLSLAEVSLAPATALQDEQTFLTSTDGRFLFANLAPGKYRLMAGRRGYAVQGLHQHEAYMTAIVTGPGQDSEHIRFPLSPSAVLTGTVSDQWNDPAREAEVILFQQSWAAGSHNMHLFSKTTTDDLGHYRFPHLLPGTYAIGVYAHPWWANFANPAESFARVIQTTTDFQVAPEPTPSLPPSSALDLVYPPAYFPNANTLSDAAKISLKPGATETADVTLRPVPSIHLHVRVPPPTPVSVSTSTEGGEDVQIDTQMSGTGVDVILKLGPDESNVIQPARKEIGPGLIELSGIPPGDIAVTADTAQGGAESGRTLSLNLNSDTELDFTSHGPLVEVSGTVLSQRNSPERQKQNAAVDPDSEPLPPADRSLVLEFLHRKTGESFKTSVSNRGEFSFASSTLPPGAYHVGFPEDPSIQVVSLEASGATVSHRTIDISSGQPVKLTVHIADSDCSLTGIALKNGKPFAGAMILLIPQNADQDPSQFHRDQSDSDGSFSLAPLFPGRYTLLALEKGWELEWSNPAVLLNYLPNGLPLELQPGGTANFNVKVQ